MKNEKAFKESMVTLSELFDKPLSKLLFEIYWKALDPFTDEECKRAFNELALSSKFFPKPADFIEILRWRKEDQAARAWIKVVETVRRVGNYQSVQFDDPVIHSVFKFWGGWPVTADWRDDELKWKQREFEKLYSIMARNDSHPAYLPGTCEIDNAARGFDIKTDIVKIGFEGKPAQRQIAAGG